MNITLICRRKKRGHHTSNVADDVLLEQPVEAMTTSTLAGVQNILNQFLRAIVRPTEVEL